MTLALSGYVTDWLNLLLRGLHPDRDQRDLGEGGSRSVRRSPAQDVPADRLRDARRHRPLQERSLRRRALIRAWS